MRGVLTTLVVTLCMRGIKPCNDHFVYCILKVVLCILLTNFLYHIQPIVDRGVIQIPHGNDIYIAVTPSVI